jgi:hypothetical protein
MAGLVPAIHVFKQSWMSGTRPGMTVEAVGWAKAHCAVPTHGGHASLCPPYGRPRLHQPRLLHGGVDEGGEERVRLEGPRLQLWVELHADEPGMVRDLDDLRQ